MPRTARIAATDATLTMLPVHAARHHRARRGVAAQPGRAQVVLGDGVERVHRGLEKVAHGLPRQAADVVHADVQRAEALHRRVHGCVDVRDPPDIGSERLRAAAQRPDRRPCVRFDARSRSATTTCAPARASNRAHALPIPMPAPVTRATRSRSASRSTSITNTSAASRATTVPWLLLVVRVGLLL